jgi:hypothetical protein
MEFTTERFECSVCLSLPTGSFVICEQCEKEVPEMAVMVSFQQTYILYNHTNLPSVEIVSQTIRIFVIT